MDELNNESKIGWDLFKDGKLKEAVSKAEEHLKENPDNLETLISIPLWYYLEDKTEQMLEAICRAHKIHPWDAMTSIMEAINACEENEQCFIRIASALVKNNKPFVAYRCCLEGLSYYPDSIVIKSLLDSIDS